METSPPTEQPVESVPTVTTYPHRWRWLGLIVLIGVLGPVISYQAPIWLAPPYTHDTPWIYVPVLFAWLIVLIVLAVMHRLKTSAFDIARIALVAVVEALLLFAFVFWWSLISFQCAPVTLTDGLAHYDCKYIIQSLAPATDYSGNVEQNWQFQGLPDSPFVSTIHTANH